MPSSELVIHRRAGDTELADGIVLHPDTARRLVHERDRHCTYPGWRTTAFVEVHHIVHWNDGGATDLTNLTLMCGHHHRHTHDHPHPAATDQ